MAYATHLKFGTALAVCLWSGAAFAQTATDAAAPASVAASQDEQDVTGNTDIVVTAQKRETTLQKTPLAITAVGGESLDSRGIDSAVDLAATVPGANFSTNGGATSITIRGVGSDGLSQPKDDPSVAAHIDGVYLARPVSLAASFYDIQRIEVLRGPQGTLYGRNATGGALNIITKAPGRDFEILGDASYGNYEAFQARGVINVPITEGVGIRAVGMFNRHDGYAPQLNPAFKDGDDAHDWGGRITMLIEPVSNFSLTLRANLYSSNGVGPTRTLLDSQSLRTVRDANGTLYGSTTGAIIVNRCGFAAFPEACADPRAIQTVFPQYQDVLSNTYSATAIWDLSSSISFKSITGFSDFHQDKRSSSRPFQPLNANQTFNYVTTSKTWTQEFNLNYDDGGPLAVVLGAFYLDDDGTNLFTQTAANPMQVVSFVSDQKTETNSIAVFGEANYEIVNGLTLTGGLRYTRDKKSGGALTTVQIPFQGTRVITQPTVEATFDSTDYKLGVDWQVSNTIFAYVSYSTAFKTGGVNTGVPLTAIYQPEKLKAWQAGIRTDWFDRRLRFNLDVYSYTYNNPQISQVLGVSLETQNASNARVKGAEAVIEARPVAGLMLSAQASYADSKYGPGRISDILDLDGFGQTVFGQIDINGNPLRFTPKWTFGASVGYEFSPVSGIDVNARADYLWQDKASTRPQNLPIDQIPAYSTLNATLRVSFDDRKYFVEVFGKNLTDETVISARFVNPLHIGEYRAPRTYGLTLGFAFK